MHTNFVTKAQRAKTNSAYSGMQIQTEMIYFSLHGILLKPTVILYMCKEADIPMNHFYFHPVQTG